MFDEILQRIQQDETITVFDNSLFNGRHHSFSETEINRLLEAFSSNTHIKSIDLSHQEFTDDQLDRLGQLTHLVSLKLRNCNIEDDLLLRLPNLSNLTELDLQENSIITDDIMHFSRSYPKLCRLNLAINGLDDEGIAEIATLPNLTWLNIRANDKLTKAICSHFHGHLTLRSLNVGGGEFELDAEAINHLKSIENLTHLILKNNVIVSDQDLALLATFPRLLHLDVSYSDNFTWIGYQGLLQSKSLISLSLKGCNLDNNTAILIAQNSRVNALNIARNENISYANLAQMFTRNIYLTSLKFFKEDPASNNYTSMKTIEQKLLPIFAINKGLQRMNRNRFIMGMHKLLTNDKPLTSPRTRLFGEEQKIHGELCQLPIELRAHIITYIDSVALLALLLEVFEIRYAQALDKNQAQVEQAMLFLSNNYDAFINCMKTSSQNPNGRLLIEQSLIPNDQFGHLKHFSFFGIDNKHQQPMSCYPTAAATSEQEEMQTHYATELSRHQQ